MESETKTASPLDKGRPSGSIALVKAPAHGMSTPAGGAIVETDGPDDAGDVLTRTCPECGYAAEYPDCAKCGFEFTAPSLSTMAEAAARYASKALPIFPLHWITSAGKCSCDDGDCRSPGKHPIAEAARRGVKDASADAGMVANWWQRWPEANIGLAMGPASGLFAVDIDPRNGGDVTLEDLEREHGRFPDTLIADTGGGGTHYLFRFDQARRLPGKLGKGIDIKGDGGYIVVEPSNHASGGRYQWRAEADPLEGAEAAQAPAWIFAHGPLSGAAPSASPSAQAGTPAAVGFIPPQQYCDLRSALGAIPSDDRDTWISVLMALRSTDAPNARALAVEWSQLSDKFDAQGFRKTWASLKPDGRIHVESIFKRAEEHGWVNPASKIAQQQAQDQGEAAKCTEAQPRFNLTRIGDLLAQPSPTDWIVKGVIDRPSLACLYGPPKSGKSFLVVDLASAVATGNDWFGRRTRQCPVIYLAGEGHKGIRKRFLAWSIARGVALDAAPLHLSNMAISLTDGEKVNQVVDEIRKAEKFPGLLIVDTLHRHLGAGKVENDTTDMGMFTSQCDYIKHALDCSVLLVHHTGHAGTHMRGSSALPAAVDWGYYYSRSDGGPGVVTCPMAKDHEPFEPMRFDLERMSLPWFDEDGEPEVSGVLKLQGPLHVQPQLGPNQVKAMEVFAGLIRAAEAQGVAYVTEKAWREAADIDRRRWPEVREALIARSLVTKIDQSHFAKGSSDAVP